MEGGGACQQELHYGFGAFSTNGRFVGRTNECGSFMLMNASFMDGVLQDNGTFLAVEPQFGISQQRPATAVLFAEDKENDRRIYQVPGFVFNVQPSQLGDRVAPYAQLILESPTKIDEERMSAGPATLKVQAIDNRDQFNLNVAISINGLRAEHDRFTVRDEGGFRTWLVTDDFSKEGTYFVEAVVQDQAGNATRLARTIRVLAFEAFEPLTDPSKAPTMALTAPTNVDSAEPSTLIKVDFSEPVRAVAMGSLYLERMDGTPTLVPTQLIARTGPVASESRVTRVYLEPATALEAGGSYRVSATAAIFDYDEPPKALQATSRTFKVQSLRRLGSINLPGGSGKIALLGSRVFVARGDDQGVTALRMAPAGSGITFQAAGEVLLPEGHEIAAFGAFPAVPLSDGRRLDLLLITTTPPVSAWTGQSVLWGYQVCAGAPVPVFSVSLGVGMIGYAPTLDCRDGLIVLGRVSSSLLLLDPTRAERAGFNAAAAISPAGYGQAAILQPFWLADPEYMWKGGGTLALSGAAHWGVGLLPVIGNPGGDSSQISVAVGYSHAGAQWRDLPLPGLPVFTYYVPIGGAASPQEPYLPDAASVAISQSRMAPPADVRVRPGTPPLPGNLAVKRLAVLPQVYVLKNGTPILTNLALGMSAFRPALLGPQNESLPPLGNSLVIYEESDPNQNGTFLGAWPKRPPFGLNVPYEIAYKAPIVDPATKLVGIAVQRIGGGMSWFIVDFRDPNNPVTVGRDDTNDWTWAALRNGLFLGAKNGTVSAFRVAAGDVGLEEGKCQLIPTNPRILILEDDLEEEDAQATASGFNLLFISGKIDDGPMTNLPHLADIQLSLDGGAFLVGSTLTETDLAKTYRTIKIKLVSTTGRARAVQLWLKDRGGTHPEDQEYADYLAVKPIQKVLAESQP